MMTLYSQRDTRWKDIKINNTQYTIGTDGCLLTCLGMIADVPPNEVVKKIGFDGAQVSWSGLENIGLELVEKTNPYDNTRVLKYIADYGQCIVRVDWDGSPKSTGDTHFVIYTGNKKLLDPWTGTQRATSVYSLATGFRAVKRIQSMPTQSELDTCLKDRQKFWDERDELLRELTSTDVDGGLNTIRGYRARITDLSNQLGTAQAEVKNREEQVGRLNALIADLQNQLKERTDQVNQFAKDKGELAIQVGKLQVQVDTLTQQVQQGSITLTWGDLFKLLLQQKVTISKN